MHFSNTLITADTTDEMALLLANIDGRNRAGNGFVEMSKIRRTSKTPCGDIAAAEYMADRALGAWEAVVVPLLAALGKSALRAAYDSGIWDGSEED